MLVSIEWNTGFNNANLFGFKWDCAHQTVSVSKSGEIEIEGELLVRSDVNFIGVLGVFADSAVFGSCEKKAGEDPGGQIRFKVSIKVPLVKGLKIFVQSKLSYYFLAEASIAFDKKVLAGRAGWLFLDNDTNRSVDQYTGHLLFDKLSLEKWERFYVEMEVFSKDYSFQHFTVIAPAKEFILGSLYPYSKGQLTPVEQFIKSFKVSCPISDLVDFSHLCYSQGDTHWTDYGAAVAADAFLRDNFSSLVESSLSQGRFVVRRGFGDLVSKLNEDKDANVALSFFELQSNLVWDSKINNHGRTMVWENPAPRINDVLIVFGDSFGVNFSQALAEVFSCVIFCHSAGSVDFGLVGDISPKYIISQLNSRFLSPAPNVGWSLTDVVSNKISLNSTPRWFLGEKIRSDLVKAVVSIFIGGLR